MMSHISRVTLWISKAIFLVSSLTACSHLTGDEAGPSVKGPVTQVYEASFEEVWRAVQKTLATYPLRLNNADTGQIETEVIRPEKMWQSVANSKSPSPGMRYFIKVSAVRGIKGNDKEAVRLSIDKVITIERDFFAGAERVLSDGLEEESMFYRIQREITLERSLKAAFDQGKI